MPYDLIDKLCIGVVFCMISFMIMIVPVWLILILTLNNWG